MQRIGPQLRGLAGTDVLQVQQDGGWKSPQMPASYLRGQKARLGQYGAVVSSAVGLESEITRRPLVRSSRAGFPYICFFFSPNSAFCCSPP